MNKNLYRAKDKKTGEWLYGLPLYSEDGSGEIDGITTKDGNAFDVIPETLGQFTGLTDKNGTKIFEGDIIKFKAVYRFTESEDIQSLDTENIKEETDVVIYKNGKFNPIPEMCHCSDYWYSYGFADFEVIGNMHDNPELLEVQ